MVVKEDFPMIEVSIPSMEREVDESGKTKKLFKVEVLFNERKHYVLRRNSEFHTLHRKLRKLIQPPDFPSKRSPHLRAKPLEQRRQELEDYIQVNHLPALIRSLCSSAVCPCAGQIFRSLKLILFLNCNHIFSPFG
uniref:PX domain-containing protein n=1 Tax=Mastacembelus armatus TaxID=205130 RepID=A0A3Q3NCW6_9TELE